MAFIDAKVNENGLAMDKLFPEITDSDIKSALNDIAKDGKAQMSSAVAVDTGRAKKSVKSRLKRLDAGGYKLSIFISEDYYAYQEWGARTAALENVGRVYSVATNIDEKAYQILKKLIDLRWYSGYYY